MESNNKSLKILGYWTKSMDKGLKSGVQYYNERLLSLLEDIFSNDIIEIYAENRSIVQYLWNLLFLLTRTKYREIDIAVFDGFLPLFGRAKKIAIVHDLMTVENQVSKSIKRKIVMDLYFRLLKRYAYRVIAVSANTKEKLVERYRIDPAKIFILHPVVTSPCISIRSVSKKKSSHSSGLKILFVGAFRRNKNIETLIRAMAILKKNGFEASLRLIGPFSNDERTALHRIIDNNNLAKVITVVGYVSEQKKCEEYLNADMLVMPSYNEGFGIPCIEALSVGLMLVCSNINVFREITYGAATFFNPYSADDLASKIQNCSVNTKKMIQNGFDVAELYNEQSARRTISDIIGIE